MRKQRDTATGRARQLGRVGALGVVATGALCAAVLSIASRMPPDPVDQGEVPGIRIGTPGRGDATQVLRPESRSARSRAEARGSHARGERSRSREHTGALALAHGKTGGGPKPEGVAGPGPWAGDDAPDRPGPGTGPADGPRGAPVPGTPGDGDGRPPPGTGGRRGGAPAAGPAPAPSLPAGDDHAGSAPSLTGARSAADEDEVPPVEALTPPPGADSDPSEEE
jgi:hypothetical protein